MKPPRLPATDRASCPPAGVARAALLPLLLLPVALAGCAAGRPSATEALRAFTSAVQAEDLGALYCLLAGASQPLDGDAAGEPRRRFDAWALSRYEAYETGRDTGGVALDPEGIVLVKTFALGKGTYFSIAGASREAGARVLTTTLRFGYPHINYETLSPGTTFYLAAPPPGRIEAVRVPAGEGEASAEVLDTLQLRWRFVDEPATADCPAGWKLAAVEPVEGSATTTHVRWRF